MATQIILLERVEKLGEMGEIVSVKPGYARNFLLPQRKALRASKENVTYFEAKKKALLAENDKKCKTAQTVAKKIEGLNVPIIRQASEAGQLFGSVSSRDIAAALTALVKQEIGRTMVIINQSFKSIGLFEVEIALHPEVKIPVTVNIARSAEEAKIQAETGKALIADNSAEEATAPAEDESDQAQLEEVLEEGALEAEKEKQAQAKAKEAEDEAKAQAKAEAKAAEEAAKAALEAEKADEESGGEEMAETSSEDEAEDKAEEE